jgi:hypothetical protein
MVLLGGTATMELVRERVDQFFSRLELVLWALTLLRLRVVLVVLKHQEADQPKRMAVLADLAASASNIAIASLVPQTHPPA